MLILERTVRWYEWGAGYFEFAGAIGWVMCALLVATFRPGREARHSSRTSGGVWLALATAFLLLAVAAIVAVLERNGGGWRGGPSLQVSRHVAEGVSALLLFFYAPLPRGGWWRGCVVVAAALPLVAASAWPGLLPASAAVLYGGGGLWLLARRPGDEEFADPDLPANPIARILGGTLVTLGVGAAAQLVAPQTALSSCTQAIGAAGTACAWWWLYLRERILPTIRVRPLLLRFQPRWLLPAAQAAALVAGSFAQHSVVRQAEQFAAQRQVDELRAVMAALTPALPAPPAGAELPRAAAGAWRAGLQTLLDTSPQYAACALLPPDPQGDAVFAVKAGREPQSLLADLRPQPDPAVSWPQPFDAVVRWSRPPYTLDLISVFIPLAPPPVPGAAPWLIAISVEAQALAEVIVSDRLQMLTIVGLVSLIVGVAVLATLRARNEAELHLLKERAEVENRARNELLAMVSHEVRTPLQSVLGYAELAAMDALPPAAERHIRAIRSQGAALLRMVQDILDLSALRSGRLELQAEPIALPALVADVRQAVAERARRKGLALSFTLEEGLPGAVIVDRVRLLQVLLNLLGNAIKFTERGGVRLTIAARGPLEPLGHARLEFRVEDTGPGIPEPHLRRIFEPFRKLREDAASNSGVGLGLAICEQIVATLNGRITVESHEGRGTTFRVELTLPTAPVTAVEDVRPNPENHAGKEEPAPGALTGLRVLLIDDHPLVRDLLRDALQKLGAQVTACADGVSGLAAVTHAAPDVVLLDLKLPDRTPEAMLTHLRAAREDPFVPWIIGLSAGATETEVQQALEGGMNDFMLKPVSISGLAETIRLSPAGAKIQEPSPQAARGVSNPRAVTADERALLLAEAAPAIVRIAHACHVGDTDRAAAEAHFLANSCVVLGLTTAQKICRDIEDAAEREDLAAAREALAALRAEIARVHAEGVSSRAGSSTS